MLQGLVSGRGDPRCGSRKGRGSPQPGWRMVIVIDSVQSLVERMLLGLPSSSYSREGIRKLRGFEEHFLVHDFRSRRPSMRHGGDGLPLRLDQQVCPSLARAEP